MQLRGKESVIKRELQVQYKNRQVQKKKTGSFHL